MDFQKSLSYLDSFVNLERAVLPSQNRFMNLDRMKCLLKLFGNPDKSFVPIIIAGTKGKGSTGFFLHSMLCAAGIPSGFYSSPHLQTPLERIRINGKIISQAAWARAFSEIRRKLSSSKIPSKFGEPTYFEIMTLAAALAFKRAHVRAAIFEVGLGGRLDATNAMDAPIAVITTLGMDHEAVLGPTLRHIAREKAAVIKRGAEVVTAPQLPEAMPEIFDRVRRMRANLHQVAPAGPGPALAGDFQRINASLAAAAARLLRELDFAVPEKAIREGLGRKDWPGRIESVPGNPEALLDGAHNPTSTQALVDYLKKSYANRKRVLVFSVARDKNSDAMLKILSGFFDTAVLARMGSPRSQETAVLLAQARKYFNNVFPAARFPQAWGLAKQVAGPGSLVVVTGSLYWVGEARAHLKKRIPSPLSSPRMRGEGRVRGKKRKHARS
ncbi:MAG TPA: folylpolyglutamate synthase/dihydrofolate synthase family protein [Verrucomicrobiae bacterium]|jgi:dihydrofolate synthase/folylpolyglutamate synthase|nr:folylpolyglutamate synthase/dihydrofolate synthase family protein [Verrucomicrobiae bacterium]